MSSASVATIVKMLESLPETAQDRVVEQLREYIQELQDDLQWDDAFRQRETQLIASARLARQQIAEGQAEPMDYKQL